MKIAKRSLAVLLALVMTFGAFSISGSAALINQVTTVQGLDGHGKITAALRVYKDVEGKPTLVANGGTVAPGDILDVHLAFGTDFYTIGLSIPVFFDETYFEPMKGDAVYSGYKATAFADGFVVPLGNLPTATCKDADGNPTTGTFFETLMTDTNKGRAAILDYTIPQATGNSLKVYPLSWHNGTTTKPDTPVMTQPIKDEYQKYSSITITSTGTTIGSTVGYKGPMKVPFAEYYSFKLRVKDAVTNGQALAPIFITPDAAKTKDNNKACQTLYGTQNGTDVYSTATSTLSWDQSYDLTNAEVDFIVAKPKPVCAHANASEVGAQAATCTVDGHEAGTYCPDCETWLSGGTVIPMLNHKNATNEAKQDATCTADGREAGTYCPDCKTWISGGDVIPMLNHKNATNEAKQDATCTADGREAGTYCPDCKTWLSGGDVIPMLNHKNATNEAKQDATCTADGHEAGTYCPDCKQWLSGGDVIPMLNHKNAYDGEAQAATCTVNGHTAGKYCPDCKQWIVPQETIPAPGHHFGEWTETKPATEAEDGEETRYCTNAGCHEFETRPVKFVPTVLTLKESVAGTEGEAVKVTAPYSKKGQIAATLTASEEGVTYEIKDAKASKVFSVDANGNVKFARMSLLHKTAVITATSADGERVATCEVTVKYKWYHYLLWIIFGCLWF